MMTNLWSANHPRDFWLCDLDAPDEIWQEAICRALPILDLKVTNADIFTILELTLGEGRFGYNRYKFDFSRRIYYRLKPILNRKIIYAMRRVHSVLAKKTSGLNWPIETRYVQFLREIIRQVMVMSSTSQVKFKYFWPENKKFAFVLTHDVETASGQREIPALADLEEMLGFRSSFNFVPERYPLDRQLIEDLEKRGFEIGVHGLRHDSSLFTSRKVFERQALDINHYMRDFHAEGFRSPYTHRNPDWMQSLQINYDCSFFDTDPFEPMPGGVMSVWPFTIGRFLELPYTLPQDCTLFNVLGEESWNIWKDKIDFIKKFNGMVLMATHPDYSGTGKKKQYYAEILRDVYEKGEYWHALPREVASWWKARSSKNGNEYSSYLMATITIEDDEINIEVPCTIANQAIKL